MALADDVIMYDLPEDPDEATLIALLSDASTRWFAQRRLAALARKGLVAATWNPHLHPRGKDGKFIRKFGWVRWLHAGKWTKGQITDISDDGWISIKPSDPSIGISTNFTVQSAAEKLYVAAPPKAKMNLPDPKGKVNAPGFQKTGGQGGSNPGAMYTLDDVFGDATKIDNATWEKVIGDHKLVNVGGQAPESGTSVIIRSGADGKIGRWVVGESTVELPDGSTVPPFDANSDETFEAPSYYTGPKLNEAWGDVVAGSQLASTGDKFYVKTAKSQDHAANELLANRLYELAGVNVAETIPGESPSVLASKVVPYTTSKVDLSQALDDPDVLTAMREDMVVDAWLANWDVVGLGLENVQVVDGVPYRIDAGGALYYRAQGSPKGTIFGPTVGELDSLRSAAINPQAAKVFGKTTDTQLMKGAERIAAIHPDEILAVSEATWPAMGTAIGNTLIARRAYILDQLGVDDPYIADPEPEVGLPDLPEGADLPDADGPEPSTWAGIIAWPEMKPDEMGNAGAALTFDDDVATVAVDVNENDITGKVAWELSATGLYGNPQPTIDTSGEADSIEAAKAAVENAYGPWYAENKAKIDYGEGYDGGFEVPSTPSAVPENQEQMSFGNDAPLAWNSDDQAWGPGYLDPQQAFPAYWAEKIQPYIDTKFEDTNLSEINTWDEAEPYVVVNGALYHVLDPQAEGSAQFTAHKVNPDGTWSSLTETFSYADMPNGPNMPVYFSEKLPVSTDLTVDTILGLQNQMHDAWISSTVKDTPMMNLVEEQVFGITPNEVGIAGVPDMKIRALPVGGGIGDPAPHQYPEGSVDKYIWDAPNDKIYQIKGFDSDGRPLVTDPVTGKDHGALDAEGSVYLFDTDDKLTHDFVVAKTEYDAANAPDLDDPVTATPDPVDPEVIAALDAKEALNDLAHANDTTIVTPSTDAPDDADEPEGPPPLSDAPPKAQSIPNIADSLGATQTFTFNDYDGDEKASVAEGMVGKIFTLMMSTTAAWDEDEMDFGMGDPAMLIYAEGWDPDSQHLMLRQANGKGVKVSLGNATMGTYVFAEVPTLGPDALKGAGAPTFKKDGTIAYGGQIVGEWSKTYGWSGQWQYTLYPQYTITGKKITGKKWNKSDLKPQVQNLVIPFAPPTKTKKSSKAVEKIQAAIQTKPGAVLSDGTEAELGQWIKSTKGGGGFVGKIVGWPDQEKHPGLAFAVDVDGVQKAVKLKTQKKVDGPEGADLPGLPSAYTGITLADGKQPQVGQKVKAGKPGSEVEGIITNINPSQGWVYILKDDGKTVSKTYSVTTVVEEPDLIWNLDDAVKAAALTTTKPKSGKAKAPTIGYPGPDGATLDHDPVAEAAWLDANPKRKLTKDGYVPRKGMVMRNSKGEKVVVIETAGEWESNPNKLRVYNFETNKTVSASTTTVQVDHAAELTGYDGNVVQKVASVHLLNPAEGTDPDQLLPDGTVVYRAKVTASWYSYTSGKYRVSDEWTYLVVDPSGHIQVVGIDWDKNTKLTSPYSGLNGILKNSAAKDLEKVAVIDSASTKTVQIKPFAQKGYGTDAQMSWSSLAITDIGESPILPTPEVPETIEPAVAETAEAVEDAIEEVAEAVVEVDVPSTPDVDTPELDGPPGEPVAIPTTSITTLTPPPQPVKTHVQKADPPLPEVVDEVGALDSVHPTVAGTKIKSVAQAAQEMLAKKDSTDPGSAITYAMGDSDFIEDMAIRYNVVKNADGTESLVARFRLREDVSEGMAAKLLTTGEGKTGAWKLQGTSWPQELEIGDKIAVYVSSQTKFLKPENSNHPLDEPNATVIGKAVKIGKSPVNPDLDLYRVKVQTADGAIGEVDMEHRATSSIKVFEYDPDAPAKVSGKQLKLTQTAQEAGWVRHGTMSALGSSGKVQIDSTGKATFGPYDLVSNMAKGSGGHYLSRNLDDGTAIRFNTAHATEGGIGFDTTRRANLAGEVQIAIPIEDGKPQASYDEALSKALQAVGVPVEKQAPPSNDQLIGLALAKLVTNYHPNYKYRDAPIDGPNDKRVTETLAYMSKELKKHLGRDVTLDDVRIHTHDNGRVQFVLSPEVAKAIGKRQGNHHFHHGGAQHRVVEMFTGVANGLLSTDERWSMGVLTTGQSSHADMTIGSGDRIYTRATQKASYSPGTVIFNPLMQATSMEVYTEGSPDHYGRRGTTNLFMTRGGHIEYMYKRRYEPEQITFYIAGSTSERDQLIAAIKKRGVTHVGSRPIEQIIVTPQQAAQIQDFDSIGEDFWNDDIPITQVIAAAAPAAGVAP